MSCCLSLDENEQVVDTDCCGSRSVVNGPVCSCINPCDDIESRGALVIETGEYAVVVCDTSGESRAVHGPVVEFMEANEYCATKQKCPTLTRQEYIEVKDEKGNVSHVQGPTLYKPGPLVSVSQAHEVYNLSKNEYIRIKSHTGELRVVRGEARVIPEPLEVVVGGVQQAVNIDNHHAVLVRNEDTGGLSLYSQHGLFFPAPYQRIVEVQEKIILEEYQTVVYKSEEGKFHYVHGDSDMRDFFLPPFCEMVTQSWSTDLRKEHTTWEDIWKFDKRPSYMNYEFTCRTIDNVELVIDVSFFWSIIDVKLLIEQTADAPGDTCAHARSVITQAISRVKLMDFLVSFNEIIKTCVTSQDPAFFASRGVELHSVEVLKFSCASEETDAILRDIIKETADRLSKKEKQRGHNEVALSRLEGEIEEEKLKKDLIAIKKSHLKTEARIEGEAEAMRLNAFLEESALDPDPAFKMYLMLRKLESVEAISKRRITILPADSKLTVKVSKDD